MAMRCHNFFFNPYSARASLLVLVRLMTRNSCDVCLVAAHAHPNY